MSSDVGRRFDDSHGFTSLSRVTLREPRIGDVRSAGRSPSDIVKTNVLPSRDNRTPPYSRPSLTIGVICLARDVDPHDPALPLAARAHVA